MSNKYSDSQIREVKLSAKKVAVETVREYIKNQISSLIEEMDKLKVEIDELKEKSEFPETIKTFELAQETYFYTILYLEKGLKAFNKEVED